jgi:hypothetical protein
MRTVVVFCLQLLLLPAAAETDGCMSLAKHVAALYATISSRVFATDAVMRAAQLMEWRHGSMFAV